MYIFGGFDGQDRLSDMWRLPLDKAQPEWEQVEQTGTVPPPCCNSPAVVSGDTMYLFSGHTGKDAPNGFDSVDMHAIAACFTHGSLFEFSFVTCRWTLLRAAPLVGLQFSSYFYDQLIETAQWGCATAHAPLRPHHGALQRCSLCVWRRVRQHPKQYLLPVSSHNSLISLDITCFRFDIKRQRWDIELPAEAGVAAPSGRCFHSASIVADAMFVFAGTVEFSHNVRSNEMFRFALDMIESWIEVKLR